MALRDRLILFLAQGFGSGRAPKGPGTCGSIVGVAWFALLLQCPDLSSYLIACVAGIFISVYACSEAERILNLRDPGSVVIDEIIALPICYLPYVITRIDEGQLPNLASAFGTDWWIVAAGFALFRLFDIAKPPPIYQSQKLPRGWGVTADDVLAGIATAVVIALLLAVAA